MKKVLCNVLYNPNVPVYFKQMGTSPHIFDLGLYEDKKSAIIAANLFVRVMHRIGGEVGVLGIENYDIKTTYVPEQSKQSYFSSVEEFIPNNTYLVFFAENKGLDKLNQILTETREDVERINQDNPNKTEKGE